MNTIKQIKSYILIFAFLFILCLLFPWSGDDWAWGSSYGIELLGTWFSNYNGRYLGNLLVLALTRSRILRAVVMALTHTAVLFLISELAGQNKGRTLITGVLIFAMPAGMFAQSIAWTSGFSNYVPSVAISLLYIYLVRNVFDSDVPEYSKRRAWICFALGIAGGLFIEHITIYNVCMALFVLVFTYMRFKRVYPAHISFLTGSTLGAVLMFSNGAYRAVSKNADWYRSVAHGLKGAVDRAHSNCIYTIIPFGFLGCFVLMLVLCMAACLVSSVFRDRIEKRWRIWHDISLTIIVAYAALSLMEVIGKVNHINTWKDIEIVGTVIYILAWASYIFTLPFAPSVKMKLFLYFGSTVVLNGSLLIVRPIGARCMFASYLFFCLLAVSLLDLALQAVEIPKRALRVILDALTIGTVICVYYYFYIYGTIAYFDSYRLDRARKDIAAGNKTIAIQNMIYDEYVWNGNPEKGTEREDNYKSFYGIDPDIRIENG